jgi:hypothetical protein
MRPGDQARVRESRVMSRTEFAYHVPDIAGLARSLKEQLAAETEVPGHLTLLNMLARGAGFRNFQHFRHQTEAFDALSVPAAAPPPDVDPALIRHLLRYFNAEGRLSRWPSKHSHQAPCLWVLWSHIPARRTFSEKEVNALLTRWHDFGDYALVRREMIGLGMMIRTIDGSVYQRVEQKPPVAALTLIRQLAARRGLPP